MDAQNGHSDCFTIASYEVSQDAGFGEFRYAVKLVLCNDGLAVLLVAEAKVRICFRVPPVGRICQSFGAGQSIKLPIEIPPRSRVVQDLSFVIDAKAIEDAEEMIVALEAEVDGRRRSIEIDCGPESVVALKSHLKRT